MKLKQFLDEVSVNNNEKLCLFCNQQETHYTPEKIFGYPISKKRQNIPPLQLACPYETQPGD